MGKITRYGIALCVFISAIGSASAKDISTQLKRGRSYVYSDKKLYSRFDSCSNGKANSQFLLFHGLEYSSDFAIIDTLKLHLNNDTLTDWVVILSPVIQEKDNYKYPCYKSNANTRLLVVLLSDGEGNYVQTINEDVILNRIEYQSEPYRKMVKEKDGFALQFYIGSSIRCYYNFHFEMDGKAIYLRKSNSECYLIDLSKQKKEERKFQRGKKTDLSTLKIRQFIKIPKLI